MAYHNSVLLTESIQGLNIQPSGVYVDVTFGGGGHSKSIYSKLNGGRLFAFDQDYHANINAFNKPGFKLINANFRYLKNFLKMEGVIKIDGLLADLGVSSHQFDIADRGFSTRFDSQLDMRMNPHSTFSAKDVVNEYSEESLADMFYKYAELKNSRSIAKKIVIGRDFSIINTTADLVGLIRDCTSPKHMNKFLARVFQAIRIEVNDEITALEEMLLSAVELLNTNGRLVVLSYHSLEDRLVKNLMKRGNFEGKVKKDFYGNPIKQLNEINSKAITASDQEIHKNPRARSVKLRVAAKINNKDG